VPAYGRSLPSDMEKVRERLQRAMTSGAGVLRDAASLSEVSEVLADIGRSVVDPTLGTSGVTPAGVELANLVRIGHFLVGAALLRTETRGAHSRADFPNQAPELRCRLVAR
jgi:L-aspartate oxidase